LLPEVDFGRDAAPDLHELLEELRQHSPVELISGVLRGSRELWVNPG